MSVGGKGLVQEIDGIPIRKILIIHFMGIGDVLFTTPLVREVKAAFPEAELVYLTSTSCAPVIRYHPCADRIIAWPWPARPWVALKRLRLILGSLELRRERFDLIFITHRSRWFNLLGAFIGGRIRVGYNFRGQGILLHRKVPLEENRYALEHYLRLLDPLGIRPGEEPRLECHTSAEDEAFGERFWSEHGLLGKCVVALQPGGARNLGMDLGIKRWLPEYFGAVAGHLVRECGVRVMLVGGPDDRVFSDQAKRACPTDLLDVTGQISLGRLAAILRRCSLFLGNDSGPLHIAAGVGTATLSVFGPTQPEFFAPRGPRHRHIVSEVPCAPCFTYGNPPPCPNDHQCMRSITPDNVFRVAREMLATKF